MILTRPMCFLDLESTGVSATDDRILELCFITLHPDGTRKESCRRFNPGIPIPAASTAIHGITDADVANEPPFSDFGARIVTALKDKDICGYNPWQLDLPMLDEELRRCGLKLSLDGVRVIDCCGIFKKKEPRDLSSALQRYCGRTLEGAHGALPDTVATHDVLFGQLSAYVDIAAMDLDSLADYSRLGHKPADIAGKLYVDEDGDMRYAFGKARDVKVKDDPGFGRWILGRSFPTSTHEALESEFERLWPVKA